MSALLTLSPLAFGFADLASLPGEFWAVLSAMAPYLLFGFLVAGILSVAISAETVERHLGGKGLAPVVKAALFGVPLPLCSCGVIPVTASLRRHGASRGATTAFLISTPQTGVDSILVTFSLLGPVYAIFRPFAALATGIVGGALVLLLAPRNGDASAPPEACTASCCSDGAAGGWLRRTVHYGFVELPRDIGKSLLIGLVLAGLITALMPKDWFATSLGTGIVPMLVMMAVGIPVYVCATASVPIAAALIVQAGLSPGAAFVFLMTGPATNAAALLTVWKVLGRRTALTYLATVAGSALLCGILLDQFLSASDVKAAVHHHEFIPQAVQWACAVVLLGILGAAFWPRRHPAETPPADQPTPATTLSVRGMTCSHCAASIKRALEEVPGVATATVDLASGLATVTGEAYDPDALCEAVRSLGYQAEMRPS